MRIQLLHVPGCPTTGQVRACLHECLQQAGFSVVIEESEGPYPSPTLLVDGVDVATGPPLTGTTCCRLDLPTHEQITTALQTGTKP